MTEYLSVEDIFIIGERATGASIVVRDIGLIDSACARPAASAFGQDAYPGIVKKAAALLHSLTMNHALIDGNKRTAWLATVVFLRLNGIIVVAPDGYEGPGARLVLEIADRSLTELSQIVARLLELIEIRE
ncbi:MAG: Fic family protein [Nakamurella sp.]